MKVKISVEELIRNQKQAQLRCIERLGKGTFRLENLQTIIGNINNENEIMVKNCNTTISKKRRSYSGKIIKTQVPDVMETEQYKKNKVLISALMWIVDMAKINNIETITDFNFTEEQILKYGYAKNIIR